MVSVICQQCKKEFNAYPSAVLKGRKFCSIKCRGNYFWKKRELICQYCYKKWILPKNLGTGNKRKRKYCSNDCHWKAMRDRVIRECKLCKKEFEARPLQIKKGFALFCSKKCYDLSQTTRKKVPCDWCKKEVTRQLHTFYKNKHRFCCRLCEANFRKSQWSRKYEKCIECGSSEYTHEARGLCCKCYNQEDRYKKYGLKKEDFLNLGNFCAICGRNATNIDHDHKTGKVRGILCSNCNTAIGLLHDDVKLLENAKKYIVNKNLTNLP